MRKYCLVSIVDSVSTTSIPINEFIIYRSGIRRDCEQIIYTRISDNRGNVKLPKDIELRLIPSSKRVFRQQIKKLIVECTQKEEPVVFHLHHQKSALLFFISTLFMGVRNKTVFTIHSYLSDRDLLYRASSCICALLGYYSNCVSLSAYYDYPRWIRFIKGERMGAILNGIDCNRIDGALDNGCHLEDAFDIKRMVCVDRIIPIKNQQFLVKLLKKLPGVKLTLVGDGDSKKEIKDLATKEGVDNRIEFVGLLPREDVYRTIAKCALYVSASKVEGLHLSVLESMRVGAIPVISDIPPHREIANNMENLFEPLPLNQDLWIDRIRYYQTLDENTRNQLSAQLKRVVKQRFSLEEMHHQYDGIYNKIIN